MTTQIPISCLSCGEPATSEYDVRPTIDGRWVHVGACEQRVLLGNDGETSEARLWAALTLWEMQQPPLLLITPEPDATPILGVITDHVGNAFMLEDQTGTPHVFTAPVAKLEVEDDAWQA